MIEIREIKVTTDRGSPDLVVFRSTLNQFPTLELRYHQSVESGVVEALAEDTAALAAEDQLASFDPQLEANTEVTIEDGQGNTLVFSGMLVKPGHHIGVGGVGSSATVIHESALMSLYDPSIYEIREPADGEGRLRFTDDSVTLRASQIIEETVKFWTDEAGSEQARIRSSDDSEAIKDALHEQNTQVYDLVKLLLDNSETEFPGLAGLDEYSNVNKAVNYDIWATLFSPRDDFLSVLHALMARWNFYYAPAKANGEVGMIRRMDWILESDGTVEVICINIEMAAGAQTFMPVTQVLVEGLGEGPQRDDDNPEDDAPPNLVPRTYAAYPETFRGGKLLRTPLPPFLTLPFKDSTGAEGELLSIDAYRQAKDDAKSNLNSFTDTQIKEFATTWAKQIYLDAALASSSVTLSTDLDVTWEVGWVYEVKALARDASGSGTVGHVLFSGLLSSEETQIQSGDNGMQASTNLQFTHVRVKENTLPV